MELSKTVDNCIQSALWWHLILLVYLYHLGAATYKPNLLQSTLQIPFYPYLYFNKNKCFGSRRRSPAYSPNFSSILLMIFQCLYVHFKSCYPPLKNYKS